MLQVHVIHEVLEAALSFLSSEVCASGAAGLGTIHLAGADRLTLEILEVKSKEETRWETHDEETH